MHVSVQQMREILARSSAEDVPAILKEWRSQEHLSQVEAALALGVSVRTLQGWELGRPMPYPRLVQRAVEARRTDRFGLVQSEFPREFAEFIDFVGGDNLDSALRKVEKKLASLSSPAQSLYGDRFYFHHECIQFSEGTNPFRLDVSNFGAVRSASLIAGINRIKRSLSPAAATRLRAMVLDNLKPDRDVRQIEHEIRCFTHLGRKGFDVRFADLEASGKFDLVVETPAGQIEVECKTISEDTGCQIKVEMNVNLSEVFRKAIGAAQAVEQSGLLTMTLKKPVSECKHLARQLQQVLRPNVTGGFDGEDFSLRFSTRPRWQELLESNRIIDLRRQILTDPDLGDDAKCVTKEKGRIIGLVIRPHKRSTLNDRVVDVIQASADQCTGTRPSVVWLHFVGMAENFFLTLAEFSGDGRGAGLNALVAQALHPSASSIDRGHVERVRFSATPLSLASQATLRPDLLIGRAVSVGGNVYDVPNSFGRYSSDADI